MKNKSLAIFFCFFLFSCQKGIHWDIASEGFLIKDNNGNCLPVSISGNYVEDSIINAGNFITVDVNVTGTGTYNIYTDTINGYIFKASGNFNNTGINHVKLICSGKPVAADTDYFTIHYDTSICEAAIIVLSNAIPAAVFSLQGAPGKCLNDTITGTYMKGIALDTTDKVNISVNVTTPGRYNIITAAVNGYTFTASGIFLSAGVQTVSIYPTGTPENAGTDVFTVMADSTGCSLEIKVNSDQAIFTLQGAPGKCMDDTVTGTYVKGIFLDTFSKVNINVNVTLPGKYAVTTNTVNGYSFTATGIFLAAGLQTITMYAKGTPINTGTDIFNITAGTSVCSFEVIVLGDIITVNSDDYFPLTDSSYWMYDDLFTKGNFFRRYIDDTSTVNGKLYKIMKQSDSYNITDQSLFRRNGAEYLEYAKEDKYTGSFQYAKNIYTELLFLKQNIQQGNYWETPDFQEASTFNQVIFLKYGYSCAKVNGVVTVNGKAFANVCIIEMRPQIHALANPWGYTNEVYTWYFAKGIGLIYYKAISNFGYRKAEMQISSWVVK